MARSLDLSLNCIEMKPARYPFDAHPELIQYSCDSSSTPGRYPGGQLSECTKSLRLEPVETPLHPAPRFKNHFTLFGVARECSLAPLVAEQNSAVEGSWCYNFMYLPLRKAIPTEGLKELAAMVRLRLPFNLNRVMTTLDPSECSHC